MMNSISIVVAAYNRLPLLQRTIESTIASIRPGVYLVIVDDGSGEETSDYLQALKDRLGDRLILHRQLNRGPAAARAVGVELAPTELVCILDSDDCLEPGALDAILLEFRRKPNLDAVYSNVIVRDDFGTEVSQVHYPYYDDPSKMLEAVLLRPQVPFKHSGFTFRRAVGLELGNYDVRLKRKIDIDFLLKFLRAGKHVGHIEQPLISFRVHGKNISRSRLLGITCWWQIVYRHAPNPRVLVWALLFRTSVELGKMMAEQMGLLSNQRTLVGPTPDLRAPSSARFRRSVSLGLRRVIGLIGLDSILLLTAWMVAGLWESTRNSQDGFNLSSMLIVLSVSIGLMLIKGLYKDGRSRRNYLSIAETLTLAQLILLFQVWQSSGGIVLDTVFWLAWVLGIAFVCAGRLGVDMLISRLHWRGTARSPIFLIGTVEDTRQAMQLLEQDGCYTVVGQADVMAIDRRNWNETFEHICRLGVTEVFVCSWGVLQDRMFFYWNLWTAGIGLRILPIGSVGPEVPFQKSEVRLVAGLPSLRFRPPLVTGMDFWAKRIFDFVGSSLLLTVLAPVYGLIALSIKLDSAGPVFYGQTRIGLQGRPFKAWKFRTMVVDADRLQSQLEGRNETKDGILFKIKDDPRITRVGRYLRRYSLDELPQLFNVLRGQMSLVGPRPLPVRDVEKFCTHHLVRHEVLPGITGLWQVSGRSNILNFEDVIRLDVSYIQNWSFGLDFKVLLKTIKVVFRKEGAY
ncbi:MAG: exopolysaccharide biosynthesis polyprenyl glycosylphosphotransferase [Gemmatimonadaceae bacterium]|nr:exopolysaccharide biosynthesis polyprenyl glycosylphosphotransferase [Gloeobacterales cyanobacterium ES-bin-141]